MARAAREDTGGAVQVVLLGSDDSRATAMSHFNGKGSVDTSLVAERKLDLGDDSVHAVCMQSVTVPKPDASGFRATAHRTAMVEHFKRSEAAYVVFSPLDKDSWKQAQRSVAAFREQCPEKPVMIVGGYLPGFDDVIKVKKDTVEAFAYKQRCSVATNAEAGLDPLCAVTVFALGKREAGPDTPSPTS